MPARKTQTQRRRKSRKPAKAENPIISFYREAFRYMSESKNYIFAIVIIFLLSTLIGFAFNGTFSFFDDQLEQLISEIDDKNGIELIWFILGNNVVVALMGLILGVMFGILPILFALLNGLILGYVFYIASSVAGPSVILYLIPHGVFELPAVFISLGMGLYWGLWWFAGPGMLKQTFVDRFMGSLRVYLGIVLVLLIIAAIIEGLLICSGDELCSLLSYG